jgi:creatinine amidohydrolase
MVSHRWAELTWPEIAAATERDPVVILPLGSIEQHGPHLPLATDTDIGVALADAAAEMADGRGVPVMVMPPVWTGYSPHHMDFPGTITLQPETFMAVVGDVAGSLYRHGVRHLLLLNSHGGNIWLAKAAADRIAVQTGRSPIVCTYWHLIADEAQAARRSPPGGMGHACELETSLQLRLDPARVRTDRLASSVIKPTNPYHHAEMFAANRVALYKPFKEYSPSGVIGDPTLATPELGERIFQAAVEAIVDVCAEIHDGRL